MAKFKLTPGVEIDVLTKDELIDALSRKPSWMAESEQGARFSRFSGQVTTASNAFDFTGPTGAQFGPDLGFVWDVRSLYISGLADADVVSVYINDASASRLVGDSFSRTTRTFLWSEQVILYPGDLLRFVGSGLAAATTIVTISGQVRELPITLAWKLGS